MIRKTSSKKTKSLQQSVSQQDFNMSTSGQQQSPMLHIQPILFLTEIYSSNYPHWVRWGESCGDCSIPFYANNPCNSLLLHFLLYRQAPFTKSCTCHPQFVYTCLLGFNVSGCKKCCCSSSVTRSVTPYIVLV